MIQQLKLRFCNVFLVTGTKPVLVDTGSPGEAHRIAAALQARGVRLADLGIILHTHGHWDHCGSSAELRRRTQVPLAIHAADAGLMQHGSNGPLRPTGFTGRFLLPMLGARAYDSVQPDILLDSGFDLRQFGLPATIVATPGHTAGSISLLFQNGEAIVGDLLMGGFLGGAVLPYWPRYPLYAEDLEGVRASVEKLLSLGARKFYVGHGGPLDYRQVLIRLSLHIPHVVRPANAPASI